MTDTIPGRRCEASGQPTTETEGLCAPCHDAAVRLELSCDWLEDDESEPTR